MKPLKAGRGGMAQHIFGCNHLKSYLEGQGDLVSRLITRISRVTMWVIGELRPKSPSAFK